MCERERESLREESSRFFQKYPIPIPAKIKSKKGTKNRSQENLNKTLCSFFSKQHKGRDEDEEREFA